jgi:tol-pal system protein YbgF
MIKQRLLLSAFVIALAVAPASAQIFGPSDEEKEHEATQDSAIHDLQNGLQQQDARIKVLEDKVRSLTDSLSQATGVNEELSHQIQLLNDKIDRMQKDFAYRLCTLSAQQVGAGDAMNCAAAGTPSAGAVSPQSYSQMQARPGAALPPLTAGTIDATGNGGFVAPPNDNGAAVMGRPPGVLGSLPMNSGPANFPPTNAPPAPANSTQYNQAMNLMSRAQYSEAAAAFRTYADTYPDDADLAPQSIYWVANISFIHQDYAEAARTFAELIKKYPKSQRAPDAMLKLAQSFMAMDQKTEGCTTLGFIKSKYPDASAQTLAQAASLRKTACSK